MTASETPPPRKTRLWWMALAVLPVVAAASIAYYWVPRSTPAPAALPEINVDGLESAVLEKVQGAHSRVLDDPRSARNWGVLGEVLLANELPQQSADCFAQAERLDPADPQWPYYRAGVLLNDGNREEALPFLRRTVELCNLQQTAPRLRLGETLLILGRIEEAADHFHQVLARQPDEPRCHFDLGLVASSRQDWNTARDHLLRCLGSPTTRQKARVQLALVHGQLGEPASAREYLAQANRLPADADWIDPLSAEHLRWAVNKRNRYRLAEQREAARRFAEAIDVLEPMTRQYPDDYLPHFAMGKVLGQMGESARATSALRRALQLAPDKVQIRYYLSLVLYMHGDRLAREKQADQAQTKPLFEEAVDLARQAIAIKPDYGFAHMSLGLSLKRLGKRPEAVAALRQAVRCNPEFAELHFELGEALAEEGMTAEARSRLELAVRQAQPDAHWLPTARTRLRSLPNTPER